MRHDFPDGDRGKDFPESQHFCAKPGTACRWQARAHESGMGFKSSSSTAFPPWLPVIFYSSVCAHLHVHILFPSLPPPPSPSHSCCVADRPSSVAILPYLWEGKLHPSVGVTNRPLLPFLSAQVHLPSRQWTVIPSPPVSRHEMKKLPVLPRKKHACCVLPLNRDPL